MLMFHLYCIQILTDFLGWESMHHIFARFKINKNNYGHIVAKS